MPRVKQHVQLCVTGFVLLAMFVGLLGRAPLVTAQIIDNAVAAVAYPVAAPFGLSVNSLTGNLYYPNLLLSVRGGQHSTDLLLSYNSSNSTTNYGYGAGWQMNHNLFYEQFDNGNVRVHDANGGFTVFMRQGNGYAALGGSTSRLTEVDGGFLLSTLEGDRYTFDNPEHGRITRYDYRGFNPLTYEYDTTGYLSRVVNAYGGSLTFFFDVQGNLNSVLDLESRRQVDFSYDNAGRMASITGVDGTTTRYDYDDNNHLTRITDPRGNSADVSYQNRDVAQITTADTALQFSFNTLERRTDVTETVDGTSLTTRYSFTPDNQLSRVETPGECVSEYSWTKSGAIASFVDDGGNRFEWHYNDAGRFEMGIMPGMVQVALYELIGETEREMDLYMVEHIVIPEEDIDIFVTQDLGTAIVRGREYSVRYEYAETGGSPVAIIEPGGRTTQLVYDGNGNVIQATDPNGNVTRMEYNERGDLVAFTNAAGDRFSFEYDSAGNIINETNPLGESSRYEYDINGNVTRIEYSGGYAEHYAYDVSGNRISSTDPAGNLTRYEYDALNRLTATITPDGGVTRYAYDGRGNLVSRTDPAGSITTYAYDADGNRINQTSPADGTTSYSYDCAGNVISQTDPTGGTTSYTYNGGGKPTQVTYSDGSIESREYDFMGQLIGFEDITGQSAIALDELLRPITVVDSNDNTLGYEYDANDNLTAYIYPDGTRYEYVYNAMDLPISITGPEGTTTIDYRFDGLPLAVALPNGITTTYTYNAAAQNTGIIHQRGAEVLMQYDYTFDAAGFIASETRSGSALPAEVINYGYDALGQLLSTESTLGTFERFAYDMNGNMLSRTTESGATTYHYNTLNQLIQATDPDGLAELYRYDAVGNLIETISAEAATNYSYNPAGHLTGFTDGGVSTEYIYNALGDRVAKVVDGERTNFLQDFNRPNTQTLAMQTEAGMVNYTYGLGQMAQTNLDGTTQYYLTDARFSVVGLADAGGNLLETYDYSAFGMAKQDDRLADFGYTGEFHDAESDLIYLRARFYNPQDGRFMSADPFPGIGELPLSQNAYSYTFNNPISYVDPSGLCPTAFWKALIGVIGAITGAASVMGLIGGGSLLLTGVGVFVFLASLFGAAVAVANYMDGGTRPGGLLGAAVFIGGGGSLAQAVAGVLDFAIGMASGNFKAVYQWGTIGTVLGNVANMLGAADTGSSIGSAVGNMVFANVSIGGLQGNSTGSPTTPNLGGNGYSALPTSGNTFGNSTSGSSPTMGGSSSSSSSQSPSSSSGQPSSPGEGQPLSSSGQPSSPGDGQPSSSSGQPSSPGNGQSPSSSGQPSSPGDGQSSSGDGQSSGGGVDGAIVPTETATATDTPMATATQVFTPTEEPFFSTRICTGGRANIRSDASTGANVVTTVGNNDTVTIIASSTDGTWYQVQLADGTIGWVADFLLCEEPSFAAPVSTATPTELPTLTPGRVVTETAEVGEFVPFDFEFVCPESVIAGDIAIYPGFFGLTLDEYLQASGLADVFDGNFPPDVNVSNPEPGVYIIRESEEDFAFEARFAQVNPGEYSVALNVTFIIPPSTPCTFAYAFTLVEGEILDITAGFGPVEFGGSLVSSTPINPIPGVWRGGFSNTEVEGCGAAASFLLDALSTSIISSDDTIIDYSGDFNTAVLREFLSSEEPLPAGAAITSPAPNIYVVTFNEEGASGNYELRVVSPTRLEFVFMITITDPGIPACRITLMGAIENLDAPNVTVTPTPSADILLDGVYIPRVLDVQGCGDANAVRQGLNNLLITWSFSSSDGGETLLVNNTVAGGFGLTNLLLVRTAPGIYDSTVATGGSVVTLEVISPTQFIETLTLTEGIVCDIRIEFTRQ